MDDDDDDDGNMHFQSCHNQRHMMCLRHNTETVVSLYTLYCVRFNETTVLTVKSTDLCLVFIKQPQNASTDIN